MGLKKVSEIQQCKLANRSSYETLARILFQLYSISGVATIYSSIRELLWLEYLKSVFLKMQNVTTWSVFQYQVTNYCQHPPKFFLPKFFTIKVLCYTVCPTVVRLPVHVTVISSVVYIYTCVYIYIYIYIYTYMCIYTHKLVFKTKGLNLKRSRD